MTIPPVNGEVLAFIYEGMAPADRIAELTAFATWMGKWADGDNTPADTDPETGEAE